MMPPSRACDHGDEEVGAETGADVGAILKHGEDELDAAKTRDNFVDLVVSQFNTVGSVYEIGDFGGVRNEPVVPALLQSSGDGSREGEGVVADVIFGLEFLANGQDDFGWEGWGTNAELV